MNDRSAEITRTRKPYQNLTVPSPNSCLVLTNASEDGKIHGEGQRGVWRERQRERRMRG